MNLRYKSLAAATLALLFLAACGSSGGLGDVLGGGGNNQTTNGEIRGTVDSVDLQSRSIYLTNVSGYDSRLSGGGGGRSRDGNDVRVYFDDNTPVDYQGRNYRVQDLERGDEVALRVDQSGNRLVATSMSVTYNAAGNGSRGGSSYPNSGSNSGVYGSNIRGTVRNIDTSRRTIELNAGYNSSNTLVSYDNNTYVQYNGTRYRPEDLERGDEIDIRVRDLGNGRLVAEDVNVTRSISGSNGRGTGNGTNNGGIYGNGNDNNNVSTVRGTVRRLDTNRRTIELDQASWINGFNRNTSGTSVIVQYDNNVSVEVNGQMNAVTGLERGDVIDVEVSNSNSNNSTLYANRIILVRDVKSR